MFYPSFFSPSTSTRDKDPRPSRLAHTRPAQSCCSGLLFSALDSRPVIGGPTGVVENQCMASHELVTRWRHSICCPVLHACKSIRKKTIIGTAPTAALSSPSTRTRAYRLSAFCRCGPPRSLNCERCRLPGPPPSGRHSRASHTYDGITTYHVDRLPMRIFG